MLEVRGLCVSYGPISVLSGNDLTVGDREVVALIGPNGAGKTTTLNAIAGLVPRTGEVIFDGEPLPAAAEQVVTRGVALVPQGRRIFPSMTVEENLYMGAYSRGGTWRDAEQRFGPIYEIFPRLAERRRQTASSLSGGEQQMLVIGRALLSEPKIVLIDELSLGLAPKMVLTLLETIQRFNTEQGTACVHTIAWGLWRFKRERILGREMRFKTSRISRVAVSTSGLSYTKSQSTGVCRRISR